jgi:plastocyanin
MKKTDPINDQLRQGGEGATTENAQNMHASIHRKKLGLRDSREMFRIRLLGICVLAIIMSGALLVYSRGLRGKGEGGAPSNAAAPARAPTVASPVTQVSMRNLQFYPVTLELTRGGVVEWKNDDLVPHTATSTSFNSGTIVAGQSWRHTFTDVGKFPYVCAFHPQMKGVVIVK